MQTWILYLDGHASTAQRTALEAIFTGTRGGAATTHFPWAWKTGEHVGVRSVAFEVSHERRRQLLRIRDLVTVRIRDRYPGEEIVSCVIPGHEQVGEELLAEELATADGPLQFG